MKIIPVCILTKSKTAAARLAKQLSLSLLRVLCMCWMFSFLETALPSPVRSRRSSPKSQRNSMVPVITEPEKPAPRRGRASIPWADSLPLLSQVALTRSPARKSTVLFHPPPPSLPLANKNVNKFASSPFSRY